VKARPQRLKGLGKKAKRTQNTLFLSGEDVKPCTFYKPKRGKGEYDSRNKQQANKPPTPHPAQNPNPTPNRRNLVREVIRSNHGQEGGRSNQERQRGKRGGVKKVGERGAGRSHGLAERPRSGVQVGTLGHALCPKNEGGGLSILPPKTSKKTKENRIKPTTHSPKKGSLAAKDLNPQVGTKGSTENTRRQKAGEKGKEAAKSSAKKTSHGKGTKKRVRV